MYKLNRLTALRHLILLICSIFFMKIATAQTVSVQSPTDSLTVGQTFDVSITIRTQSAFSKIIFPDSTHFPSSLSLHKSQHFRVNDFSDSTLYKLQFFSTESITLPPLPVRIIGNSDTTLIFTNPLVLAYKKTISSIDDEFKPLKPIYDFPKNIWPYLIIALLVLIIGYLIWRKFFLNNTEEIREEAPVPIFVNPLDELERSLSRIRNNHQNLPQKNFKHFYSELGDALRLYFEDLYDIPALESTTREVLRYLDAFGVDNDLIYHTRKVLNEADMIKFAKFNPTLDQSWKALDEADAFLIRAKNVDIMRIERKREEFIKLNTKQEDADGMG